MPGAVAAEKEKLILRGKNSYFPAGDRDRTETIPKKFRLFRKNEIFRQKPPVEVQVNRFTRVVEAALMFGLKPKRFPGAG